MLVSRTLLTVFATGFGVGYLPKAPGTAGTLVAIPLSLAVNHISVTQLPLALITLAAFMALAIWVCHGAEELFGKKDAQMIVIDEMAGFLAANFLMPAGLISTACAFLLFRFFDIIKLYPARRAERIPGGWGVISDDLIAGCYTQLSLRLLMVWGFL